jgi:hypothetical protein
LSTAVGGSANGLALGAVVLLAEVLGATHVTLGLVTVNLAFGTLSLLAVNLTFRTLADRVALCRADGVVTLPTTFRVAVAGDLKSSDLEVGLRLNGESGESKHGNKSNDDGLHLVGSIVDN